jgi:uncharacterized protein
MNKTDQLLLLKLARNTLESYFKDIDPDTIQCSHLTSLMGCFVTLYKNKQLRGCIGFPRPIMPLYEQVIAATKAAAFEDPRFDPLIEEEMKDIKIEISLLTEPKLINAESQDDYNKEIIIGRDGLIVQSMGKSGLLLPQVATEYHLNVEQFLESLCAKAGIPNDSWKSRNTKIYKFQAVVFGE